MVVSDSAFVYMWEYSVSSDSVDQFRDLYGPQGEWVKLFQQAAGFIETTLFQDRKDHLRYVTLDRWESEAAFRAFRVTFAAEYERLDRAGERLTLNESPLGDFRADTVAPLRE